MGIEKNIFAWRQAHEIFCKPRNSVFVHFSGGANRKEPLCACVRYFFFLSLLKEHIFLFPGTRLNAERLFLLRATHTHTHEPLLANCELVPVNGVGGILPGGQRPSERDFFEREREYVLSRNTDVFPRADNYKVFVFLDVSPYRQGKERHPA